MSRNRNRDWVKLADTVTLVDTVTVTVTVTLEDTDTLTVSLEDEVTARSRHGKVANMELSLYRITRKSLCNYRVNMLLKMVYFSTEIVFFRIVLLGPLNEVYEIKFGLISDKFLLY